jgi:hypothetical protein
MPKKVELKKEEKVESKAVSPVKDPILDEEETVQEVETPKEAPKRTIDALLGKTVTLTPKAKLMKEKLEKEDRTTVFVPLSPGEKLGVTQSIVLNGYPMFVPKGKYVQVPITVKDILEEKLKGQMMVENHPNKIGKDGSVKLSQYGN